MSCFFMSVVKFTSIECSREPLINDKINVYRCVIMNC